jgi:hypothetical protein
LNEFAVNDYEKLIEKVLRYFAGETMTEELAAAKKHFFGNVSLLEDNSDQFEMRMAQFYDWYFFTRPLNSYGQTPLQSCFLVRELRFTDQEKHLIEALKQNIHGLFQFIKIKDQDVYIKNIFTGQKLIVKKSPWIYGFEPEQYFEARLIPLGETYIFTRGFCFHPQSASKYILDEIKAHKKDPDMIPDDFMLKLIKMRYKFDQYKHLQPDLIYSNDSKVMSRQ